MQLLCGVHIFGIAVPLTQGGPLSRDQGGIGAGFRNRTEDLPLTRRVLYQLS